MTWKWAALWTGLALAVLATPAAGLAGMAAWQGLAPASLRQAVLAIAALTEPKRVDRMLERIEVAVDAEAANPG